jgi:thioester reductase-like protein
MKINTSRGLIALFDPSRVTFVHCDFSNPSLGLDGELYEQLVANVSHIIHNAWTVNFNMSLPTMVRANFTGLQFLIDLTANSLRRAQLFFISSLGTVMNWRRAGHEGPVPEEIINDGAVAEELGYTESKHVAERLLDLARVKSGIDACCFRVGQIAGPIGTTKGAWNPAEWLPSLVASCKTLGRVPKSIGPLDTVDWIPINTLAEILVELVYHGAGGQRTVVYNLVNPSTTTWSELYPAIQRCLQNANGRNVDIVEYAEWLQSLHDCASSSIVSVEANPAVKLLDFFDGLQRPVLESDEQTCSTREAEKHSSTLRSCGPVNPEWMELWMEQWGIWPKG